MEQGAVTQKVIKGFAWEGSTKLFVQLITWVTTILVARMLSPEDYGVVAISGVFIGALVIITDMGFMSALINQKDITSEQQDSTFWFSIMISIILFALIYFSAPFIAAAYEVAILADIIRVSAIILPLTSLKIVPVAIAMRELNYKYRAITEMAGQLVAAMTSIFMVYNGFGVWTLVYSVIAGQCVVVAAYLPLMKRVPLLRVDIGKIRNVIAYGIHMMFSQILEYFVLRSDVFIISMFLPQRMVGLYSMGLHLATMPLDKIGSIFNRVGFPAISRVKGNGGESKKLFLYMHRYLVIITYPILVGFFMVAEDLVPLVLTEKWLPVVPLIQALCLLNMMRVSGMIMPYAMAGLGYSGKVLKYHILSSIVLPVAFLVGVQYGIDGVLAGWFVAYPLLYVVMLRMLLSQMGLPFRDYLGTLRPAVTCSLVMYMSVSVVQSSMTAVSVMIDLMVSVPFGAAIYLLSFYLFFRAEFIQVFGKFRSVGL